jgi:hypothetical protein
MNIVINFIGLCIILISAKLKKKYPQKLKVIYNNNCGAVGYETELFCDVFEVDVLVLF